MRLSDFMALDLPVKKHTLLHEGVLLAKRKTTDHLVMLFELHGYYVEAFCNVKEKVIDGYQAFTGLEPLDEYLDTIPIDGLLA